MQPHIVYILTKLELGGAQKVCLALMQQFAHQNIRTSLITGAEGVLVSEAQKFDSVYFLPSFKREVTIGSLGQELKTAWALIKILRQLKKHHGSVIVHTHSTKAGLLGRWAAFFAGIKIRVHTIHGYGFHDQQPWIKWFLIYFCELLTSLITTHFVCVSDKDRQAGIRLFPRFARKSSIIRAAVDAPLFTAAQRTSMPTSSNTPCIIGTVSCFKPQKNLFDLLHAFKQVHQTRVHSGQQPPLLHIIGDGDQRPAIEQWIQSEHLTQFIVLLGWQENVASWMKQWHIFALSSLWEGLPMAVIEARFCKLPVVAYAVGGIPEVITNGKNGFLVPPKDWPQLASGLLRLIQHHSIYTELSQHRDALNDFTNTAMACNHHKLYCVLSRKSANSLQH